MTSHSASGPPVLPHLSVAEIDVLLGRSLHECFLLDNEQRIVYANDRAVEASGLSLDDLVGHFIQDIVPDPIGSALDERIRRARSEQEAIDFEAYAPERQRRLLCRVVPLSRMIGVWISESVVADVAHIDGQEDGRPNDEYATRDRAPLHGWDGDSNRVPDGSNELLERLIDSIPVMIAIWDPHVRVLRLNREFERVLGWTSEDIGDNLMQKVYPDPVYRKEVQAFMERLEPGWREFEVTAKNGEKVFSAWANISLSDDRRVGIGIDLRERKQAEEKLRKLNATLERRVKERTAELEQRARELQSFAYVASHDLQEPLRKIRTFADLMVSDYGDQLDEEPTMFLDRIQDGAVRMQKLLADLLDYSRVSTRGRPFALFDLKEVVDEVLLDLTPMIERTRADVDVDAAVRLEADRRQVRQVITQLVQNALKFRRDGLQPHVSIAASIEAASVDGQAHMCRIVVDDNGIGFDAEKYGARIFEPFERLYGRGRYEGTGMGLAIARRIVQRHGGTISTESTPGHGSRFTVRLPLRQNAAG